ncbi:hypothetical protein [Kitasatospora aureofaciens]|uniref:hypothetical protein n=1 Tax=Kitasatospora aureofaciens TaxID=1894 RepID=UPI003826A92C
MSDHPGRPARRPLSPPFSHANGAVDEPLTERLLPAQRLGSPFSAAVHPVPAPRPASGGRRPLGEGGPSYATGAPGD